MKTKTTIHFADTYAEFFEKHNLKSYDDFFGLFDRNYFGEETKSIKSKSDVQLFTLGDEPDKSCFFLKRFYNPGFKNTIRAWMQYGKPVSHGKLESENANLLLANGIGACKPVCYGEKTTCGFESESFFVTAQLPGQALDKFVFGKWESLVPEVQNKIIIDIANTVRKVHALNVSMRDLYVGHIFIAENNGKYDLNFIDLENMSQNVIVPLQKARDLGRLLFSMIEDYFDEDAKQLLLDTYLADRSPAAKTILRKVILAREKEMTKRRKMAPYHA